MKTGKLLCTAIAMAITFFVSSCAKDDKNKCKDHSEKIIAFPYINATVFQQYQTPQNAGNVLYLTAYATNGGRSSFIFDIAVSNVCPHTDPLLSSTMVLKNPDANLTDSIGIGSNHGGNVAEAVFPSNGTVYDIDEFYTFDAGSPSPVGFTFVNKISIPAQGSWAADSAYFFSNLDNLSVGGSYNTTQ